MGEAKAKEADMIFYEVSAKSGNNIQQVFKSLITQLQGQSDQGNTTGLPGNTGDVTANIINQNEGQNQNNIVLGQNGNKQNATPNGGGCSC